MIKPLTVEDEGQRCEVCYLERRRRCRVASGPNDPMLRSKKFKFAVSVVANNDLKYEIGKRRAADYAKTTGQLLLYAKAIDTTECPTLRSEKTFREKQVQWLTKNDSETGNLWGVLPLAAGMRIRLTRHLDRSRGLLKGSYGTLLGWDLDPQEPNPSADKDTELKYLPTALYIQFDNKIWTLPGMKQGVYVIDSKAKACKATWNIIKGKANSASITRRQFPIQPDYSATIYSVQGLTMAAIIADLKFDAWTNATSGYVAMSRVCLADDFLIMQPFDVVTLIA